MSTTLMYFIPSMYPSAQFIPSLRSSLGFVSLEPENNSGLSISVTRESISDLIAFVYATS